MILHVYADQEKYTLVYDGKKMALAQCGRNDTFNINTGVAVALQKFCLQQFSNPPDDKALDLIGSIVLIEDMANEIRRGVPAWLENGYTLDVTAQYIYFNWTELVERHVIAPK